MWIFPSVRISIINNSAWLYSRRKQIVQNTPRIDEMSLRVQMICTVSIKSLWKPGA